MINQHDNKTTGRTDNEVPMEIDSIPPKLPKLPKSPIETTTRKRPSVLMSVPKEPNVPTD
jgi:hypothetical protein